MAEAMMILLMLLMLRAIVLPWGSRLTLHDPISALVALLPEALTAAAPVAADVGAGALADVGLGAGSLFGAADAAGLGATAGIAGAGDLAAATTAAGLGTAADIGGLGLASVGGIDAATTAALAPAITDTLGGLGSTGLSSGASAADTSLSTGALSPVSGASSLSTASPALSVPATPAIPAANPIGVGVSGEPSLDFSQFVSTGSNPTADAAAGLPAGPASGPAVGAGGSTAAAPTSADVLSGADIPGTVNFGGGAEASSNSLIDKVLPGAGSFLKDNKELLGIGGAAASLLPLLFGNNSLSQFPNFNTASTLASTTANTSEALQTGALHGVLPAGYEDTLQRAKDSGMAAVRSNYASLGESGSTAEATDVANVGMEIEAQRAKVLDSLLTSGISAAGTAGAQNIDLAKLQISQDEELQKALQSLAGNLILGSFPARVSSAVA